MKQKLVNLEVNGSVMPDSAVSSISDFHIKYN